MINIYADAIYHVEKFIYSFQDREKNKTKLKRKRKKLNNSECSKVNREAANLNQN